MDSNSKAVSTPLLKSYQESRLPNPSRSCLAKCDGVDELLKISRYAAKIILSSSPKPPLSTPASNPLNPELAFPTRPSASTNSSRTSMPSMRHHPISLFTYGGGSLYYFVK
ncbi:peroxisomal membrane protein 11A [Cinnamomum micranthum f. kanehirae]|uniref:Peroxisomal membrane protein 11A n=1 Tax=Cinnamomum micranthum f. kanehirae TaxID=337451 RepID=A0A3S3MXN6_9MAGN|nr:peroxisomal membrane protein 11A [Cinnamomum micranthum f. kanehirae]